MSKELSLVYAFPRVCQSVEELQIVSVDLLKLFLPNKQVKGVSNRIFSFWDPCRCNRALSASLDADETFDYAFVVFSLITVFLHDLEAARSLFVSVALEPVNI